MAQQTIVSVICDMPHRNPHEGAETVRLALEGQAVEIDLCGKHRAELDGAMASFTAAARTVKAPAKRSGVSRFQSASVRAWAVANRIPISTHGRIPAEVLAQYAAAR
jgi:Lsr2